MHVESIVGAGSRFEVWLPRVSAVAATSGEVIATLPFGHGETVLVVEQDAVRLLRDEEIFAALGYEPVGLTRAAEAQARCRESPQRFDAVVVGHLAPMAEALDLALALHEIAPALPILLATASTDGFATNALVTAGISDVVAWPINATEMATMLDDCLRRKDSQRDREAARNDRQSFQCVGVGR
jgi:DNA-binding NtrC family response regulator